MLKKIATVFWNRDEHRLRMLWRLALQTLVLTILNVPTVIIGVVVYLAREYIGLPPVLTNPIAAVAVNAIPMLVIALTTLVSIWLVGRFVDRRRFADFGAHLNRDWWIDFWFGIALGAVLMGLIFAIELAAGWITITGTLQVQRSDLPALVPTADLPFGWAILLSLFVFVLVGIREEFFSRGYHLKNMAEGLGFLRRVWQRIGPRGSIAIATLLSSAIFGLLHAGNPNATVVSTFNLFVAGVLLAMGYILTGELATPIGLHIAWNFFQGNVFGFRVSGIRAGATFIGIYQGGAPLVTGGDFGPEAGLVGLGAMLLGSGLTVLWVRLRTGRRGIYEELATPDLLPRRKRRDDAQGTEGTPESAA